VIQPEWKQLFGEVIIVCELCKSATDHAAHCSIGRAKKAGKAPKIEIKKGNEEQKIKLSRQTKIRWSQQTMRC